MDTTERGDIGGETEGDFTHNSKCNQENDNLRLCHLQQKIILRQKKNYENSNISPCKNIIFNKSPKKKPESFKIL